MSDFYSKEDVALGDAPWEEYTEMTTRVEIHHGYPGCAYVDVCDLLTPSQRAEVARRCRVATKLSRMKFEREGRDRSVKRVVEKTGDDHCVACGSRTRLTVDHIIPTSRGGLDDASNLQCLCMSCNCAKGARTMDEWLAEDDVEPST